MSVEILEIPCCIPVDSSNNQQLVFPLLDELFVMEFVNFLRCVQKIFTGM